MSPTPCTGIVRADWFCYRPEHNRHRTKRPQLSVKCPKCGQWIFTSPATVREDSPRFAPLIACNNYTTP